MSATVGALVAAGRTSDVYEFGARSIVKVPRDEVPGHWAAIEAELADAVHRHGLPTPEVDDLVSIDGQDCIVFGRVDGETMWQQMAAAPGSMPGLVDQLVELQQLIHRSGIPTGVPDLVARLGAKIDECSALPSIERARAVDVLDQLPVGAALLHGDLHPGNVLMSADGPIVIDWFDATIGHPLADVMRTALLIRADVTPEDRPHLPGASTQLLEAMSSRYLDQWGEVLPVTGSAAADWAAVHAIARIAEGVHADDGPLLERWYRRGIDAGHV